MNSLGRLMNKYSKQTPEESKIQAPIKQTGKPSSSKLNDNIYISKKSNFEDDLESNDKPSNDYKNGSSNKVSNNKDNKDNKNYRKVFTPNVNTTKNDENSKDNYNNFNKKLSNNKSNLNEVLPEYSQSRTPCGLVNNFPLPLKTSTKQIYTNKELIEAKKAIRTLIESQNNSRAETAKSNNRQLSNNINNEIITSKQTNNKKNKYNNTYEVEADDYIEMKKQEQLLRDHDGINANYVESKGVVNPNSKVINNPVFHTKNNTNQKKNFDLVTDNNNVGYDIEMYGGSNSNYNYYNDKIKQSNIEKEKQKKNEVQQQNLKQIQQPKIEENQFSDDEDQDLPINKKSSNQDEEPDEYEEDDNGEKQECPDCGRQFKEKAYAKHIKICKKVFMKKRKPMDMKAQRIVSDEHKEILKHNEIMQKKAKKKEDKEKEAKIAKNNWKAKSEMFRQAMKASTQPIDVVVGKGKLFI